MFGIKTSNGNKYAPSAETLDDMDDFAEALEDFVEDYLKGKLKVRLAFDLRARPSAGSRSSNTRVN